MTELDLLLHRETLMQQTMQHCIPAWYEYYVSHLGLCLRMEDGTSEVTHLIKELELHWPCHVAGTNYLEI
jgi:hypothetical protein